MGFPLRLYSINGKSVISKEATLYIGFPSSSKKSTEDLSKGEEKQINPSLDVVRKMFMPFPWGMSFFIQIIKL